MSRPGEAKCISDPPPLHCRHTSHSEPPVSHSGPHVSHPGPHVSHPGPPISQETYEEKCYKLEEQNERLRKEMAEIGRATEKIESSKAPNGIESQLVGEKLVLGEELPPRLHKSDTLEHAKSWGKKEDEELALHVGALLNTLGGSVMYGVDRNSVHGVECSDEFYQKWKARVKWILEHNVRPPIRENVHYRLHRTWIHKASEDVQKGEDDCCKNLAILEVSVTRN